MSAAPWGVTTWSPDTGSHSYTQDPPGRTEAASLWTLLSHKCLPVGDLLAETDKNVRDSPLTSWGTGAVQSMQGAEGTMWGGRL